MSAEPYMDIDAVRKQLPHLGVDGRGVEKFGENQQAHIAKRAVAHHGLLDERQGMADPAGEFRTGGGVGQVGLAACCPEAWHGLDLQQHEETDGNG